MPSKDLVFIHHSQRDGRLSEDNARKVWAHVSRRSGQKRPKQFTITLWKPPRRFRGRHESHLPSDQEAIEIPYSNLEQAYLSKMCLKNLKPPEGLAMLETTLLALCEHTVKGYTLVQSETHAPDDHFAAMRHLTNWCFSVRCGSTSLLNNNVSQAFASFEFASRILRRCLTEKNSHFFSKVLVELAYAQSRNAHDVVQLFLKQIAALATTSFGPRHPISVCARNILVMGINPALVEKLFAAESNAVCSAGFLSRFVCDQAIFAIKCDVLGAGYHLNEAEQTFQNLINRNSTVESSSSGRYAYQLLTVYMAQLYLEHKSFSKAASILSDAPADLDEYVSKGWVPTLPPTAPVSMTMIVWRLYSLGQALAAQGDHESADGAFKSAVSAGLKYLDRDDQICISAQKAYSVYLSSQNRTEEANEIEQLVDLRLDMYKLTLSNDE